MVDAQAQMARAMETLAAALPRRARFDTLTLVLASEDPAAAENADQVAPCPGPDPFGANTVIGCVQLSGTAESRADVSKFVQDLAASPLFVEPFVETTTKGTERVVTFTGSVGLTPQARHGDVDPTTPTAPTPARRVPDEPASPSVTKLLGGARPPPRRRPRVVPPRRPYRRRAGRGRRPKTAAQDRSSSMSVQLAKLRAQAEDLPKTRRQAAEIALALPATADQPGFFAAVNDAADDAGIKPDQITDISQGAPQLVGRGGGRRQRLVHRRSRRDPRGQGGPAAGDRVGPVRLPAPHAAIRNIETMDRVLFMTTVDVTADTSTDGTEGAKSNSMKLTITGVAVIAPPIEPAGDDPGNDGEENGDDTDQASG